MSAFTSRKTGHRYRAGFALQFFAFALFLIGFEAPYWGTANTTKLQSVEFDEFDELKANTSANVELKLNQGLWTVCVSTGVIQSTGDELHIHQCRFLGFVGLPLWFHVVRTLEAVGMILLFATCLYALATINCRSVTAPPTRRLEILACAAGAVGFLGCLVHVAWRPKLAQDASDGDFLGLVLSHDPRDLVGAASVFTDYSSSWACHLAAAGSALSCLAAWVVGSSSGDGNHCSQYGMTQSLSPRLLCQC